MANSAFFRKKTKFGHSFECWGCGTVFSRRRALQKHQAEFWPGCDTRPLFRGGGPELGPGGVDNFTRHPKRVLM